MCNFFAEHLTRLIGKLGRITSQFPQFGLAHGFVEPAQTLSFLLVADVYHGS